MPSPASGPVPGKYARVEREHRYLLASLPDEIRPASVRRIIDRYLTSTSLRLRHTSGPEGHQYKLTQKIPATHPGPIQGLITNIYLSRTEHEHLAAALPATTLTKTRYSIPPLGIDVFDPPLHGLVMAEAEFGTEAEMRDFHPPSYVIADVTADPRFTGGHLARAQRQDLITWLTEYRINLSPSPNRIPPQ